VKKLAALFALYFAQGLPFGVQASALPLLLRERGASLQTVGFASALSLPWLTKALWAPLVDRYGSRRFGRRKSWIVPMQLGLVLTALAAGYSDDLAVLAALVLLMNVFAATQDIAVDALAVRWLDRAELGPGNAMQVVGYKLGMLTGGGLLVWASAWIGFRGLFVAMAALMLGVLLWSLALHEPDDDLSVSQRAPQRASGGQSARLSLRDIGKRLHAALRQPATLALLVVMLTYKTGESLADAMWKPMLQDRGFTSSQLGLWAGTFGMACSLFGSAVAGLLARHVALPRALLWVACFRALGVAAEWTISQTPDAAAGSVIAVTCLEHLAGGSITTIVFALMMRHTDPQIGATHYTLLASTEVLGKLPLSVLSGVLAAAIGYPALFGLSTLLCVAFALLVVALAPRLAREAL
jgi:PAT family beta-lactamase induction signal transducer AmpG